MLPDPLRLAIALVPLAAYCLVLGILNARRHQRNIAKIPVCDIIDFQYPDRSNRFWHTTADTPNRCSAASLGKVGWVLQEWLATKR